MTFKLSHRAKRADPFIAMDVLARAKALEAAGRNIVHMETGQPSAPVPPAVLKAAQETLQTGVLSYTEAAGIVPFRSALTDHYRAWYDLDVPAERFIATTGSSGGFMLAFLALFDVGARVGLPMPGYPAYRNILKTLGVDTVTVPTGPEGRWSPQIADIEAIHRETPLDGLLIASPNNPTGTVIPPDRLKAIVDFCDANGIVLISDEIYHGLTFDAPAHSALEFSDTPIVISSFSKYFCMTGWRIGWMTVPPDLVRPVEVLAQNLFISVPTLSQYAAIEALNMAEAFRPLCDVYRQNRAILAKTLPRIGFETILPMDGAFYAYADISPFSADSLAFARDMLETAGVAATPGVDFDPDGGHTYIRFSLAGTTAEIAEGCRRLEAWLGGATRAAE